MLYKPMAVLLPPQKTLVTRSITLVLVEWCLLLLNPRPFIRLESSAEARSTTPCAEIDDIFVYVLPSRSRNHNNRKQPRMLVKCQLYSLVAADLIQLQLIWINTHPRKQWRNKASSVAPKRILTDPKFKIINKINQ